MTTSEILQFTVGKGPALFQQMIGVMGTPDYNVNAVHALAVDFHGGRPTDSRVLVRSGGACDGRCPPR